MFTTTFIEIERPKRWAGEPFESCLYDDHELRYIEIEVAGEVDLWTDNYGADADGNRGVEMTGVDVEDLEFSLDGDFRPFYIKVRDIFYVSWRNARYTYNTLRRDGFRERGFQGWWKIHRKNLMAWTQFSDHYSLRLDEKLFSASEIEDAVESLKQEAYNWEPDPDEYDGDQ